MQSRRMSLAEACASTAIGYVVAVAAQLVVFPAFGMPVSIAGNLAIAAIFTGISVVRGYVVRRLFEQRRAA